MNAKLFLLDLIQSIRNYCFIQNLEDEYFQCAVVWIDDIRALDEILQVNIQNFKSEK